MEKKKNEKYDLERKRPLFFGVGMTIALSLTLVAFEWKSPVDPIDILKPREVFVDPTIYIPPTTIDPPPPPPPKALVVLETTKEEEVTKDIPILDIGTNEEEDFEIIIPSEIVADEPVDEAPRKWAEIMPSYEGGLQQFYRFLATNIKYPAQAKRMGIEGKVFVQFIVEKDGSLSNIRAISGIGAGCDEEAERVMQLVQGFSPAMQGDIRVRLQMVVPINFTLQ